MTTQEIIVYAIGIAVLACVAVRVWQLVTRRKDPCSGCSGCDLKNEIEAKRKVCRTDGGKNTGCGCGC